MDEHSKKEPEQSAPSPTLDEEIKAFLARHEERLPKSTLPAKPTSPPKIAAAGKGDGAKRILFMLCLVAVAIGSLYVLRAVTPEKVDPRESPGYKLWEQATAPGLTDSAEVAMERVGLLLDGAELLQPDEELREKLLFDLDETWQMLVYYRKKPVDVWEDRLQGHLALVHTKTALPQRGPLPRQPVTLLGLIVFLFLFGSAMKIIFDNIK